MRNFRDRKGGGFHPENLVRHPLRLPYTRHAPCVAVTRGTSEGRPVVRYRTAVVVPCSQYEVILVSPSVRCPLRGRYRMPVTNV